MCVYVCVCMCVCVRARCGATCQQGVRVCVIEGREGLRRKRALRYKLCCSVLECVAVCCSVLQCVAVCCSVLQCAGVCCSVL